MKNKTYRFELVTAHTVHTIIFLNFVTVEHMKNNFLGQPNFIDKFQ
jgi:hypothetical protein